MRILYLTQWFEPEPNIVKGIAFVRGLEAAGHEVTVVTGLPNYPTGRLYPGYRVRLLQHEVISGVRVVRLPLYPSHDGSSLRRSLNFLSFFISGLLYCLLRRRPYDIAYVYHPPITVGLAAAIAGLIRPLRFVLDVQDLWPDTLPATGMTGGAALARIIGPLCAFVYRRSAAILVPSEGIKRALIERRVPAAKLALVLNWANFEHLPALQTVQPEGAFSIVYAGNLGRAQGLETLIAAAAIIQREREDIRICIYGDGVEADRLARLARDMEITILSFEGRRSAEEIAGFLSRARALVMHLADKPLFSITIPSKTQFYLAMGRPIVAGISGDAARLLERSGAALVVHPGDPAALARALCTMADMPAADRDALGARGRQFYLDRLSLERGLAETLQVLEGTCAQGAPAELMAT
jgi:colanic acid biosynthesis glycosyl transferase WcaI